MVPLLAVALSGVSNAGDPPDARSLAMASVWLSTTPAPGTTDPASLSRVKEPLAGIHVSDPYGIPELGQTGLSASLPVAGGAFGFNLAGSGTADFRILGVHLAFGKELGLIRAGIRIRTLVISQGNGFGNAFAVLPAIAVQAEPLPSLTLGLEIDNPAAQGYHPGTAGRLPMTCRAGAGFRAGEEAFFCLEMEKTGRQRALFRLGMETTLHPGILLRFGITTSPALQYAFGIGLKFNRLEVDFAAGHHAHLGYTPSLSLVRHFRAPTPK